jgi:uncharacterized protein YeaO (DUF488 family)
MIRTEKTVYDPAEESDGKRILVMRTWPRGVPKNKVDIRNKELGTEKELIRRWKAWEVAWAEFAAAYDTSLIGKEGFA